MMIILLRSLLKESPELKALCLVPFPSQMAPFFSQFLQFLSAPVPITQTPMHL